MKQSTWNWRVVLVRPRNPLNIGAAARAMANFGFRDLVVVSPYSPVWQETRSAVGAEEVVKSGRAVDDFTASIGDCSLVVGTTSGSRRNVDRELIPLRELSAWLKGRPRQESGTSRGRAALLFGSEKTGLSSEQMSFCHGLVRIPTAPECPSMNLGQAVAVCCYELAGTQLISTYLPTSRLHLSGPASMQSLDHILSRAARVLDEVGYLKPKSRRATVIKLRRLLLDFSLTNHDAKILGGVLAQIEWKLRLLRN